MPDIRFKDYRDGYSFREKGSPRITSNSIKYTGSFVPRSYRVDIEGDAGTDKKMNFSGFSDSGKEGKDKEYKTDKLAKSEENKDKNNNENKDKEKRNKVKVVLNVSERSRYNRDGTVETEADIMSNDRYVNHGNRDNSYKNRESDTTGISGNGYDYRDINETENTSGSGIKYYNGSGDTESPFSAGKGIKNTSRVSRLAKKVSREDEKLEKRKQSYLDDFLGKEEGLNSIGDKAFKPILKALRAVVILLLPFIVVVMLFIVIISSTVTYVANIVEQASKNTAVTSNDPLLQEKYLYKELMDYFDNNETAVLGIMCNIKAESGFCANNLQDDNAEQKWGTSDSEYTSLVNSRTITKEEFIDGSGTYFGDTDDNKNKIGYGYCQYTYYSKKQGLYEYTESWFSEDGLGYGQDFNIADPVMQTEYIKFLLDGEYSATAEKLRNASSIYEAIKIWFGDYEMPSGNAAFLNSYTVVRGGFIGSDHSDSAASIALQIKDEVEGYESITPDSFKFIYTEYEGDFAAMEGTYIFQTASGPCVACSVANMVKRYCYMMGDSQWDSITSDMFTDDGSSLYNNVVVGGSVSGDWVCFDSSGYSHLDHHVGWTTAMEGRMNIHGISCHFVNVSGKPSKEGLISLLNEHPEGISVTGTYGSNKAHGKTLTRYDAETDTFYCIDPGAWGGSSIGYADPNAGGRYEMKLSDSRCWTSIESITQYRYIVGD